MGLIRIVGKTLEFSGKIVQSASFEDWAINEGEKIVESIAAKKTIALLGKKRAAKKELWDNLKLTAEKPALARVLNDLAKKYMPFLENCADNFEDNQYLANGNIYLMPRFLPNSLYEKIIRKRLDASDEFRELKGGAELRSFFYKEFVAELDAALLEIGPSPQNPVQLENNWYIASVDTGYDWKLEGENWKGYFLLYGSSERLPSKKLDSRASAVVEKKIEEIELQLGGFTKEEKVEWARSWKNLELKLANGEKFRKASTMKTAKH